QNGPCAIMLLERVWCRLVSFPEILGRLDVLLVTAARHLAPRLLVPEYALAAGRAFWSCTGDMRMPKERFAQRPVIWRCRHMLAEKQMLARRGFVADIQSNGHIITHTNIPIAASS